MRRPRLGLTILELVVVVIAIVVIFALLIPVAFPPVGSRIDKALSDKAQVKLIHQAMLVHAEDNNGRLPLPGRIDPIIRASGDHVEDVTLNYSAPLYSAMIAQQLINTAIVIGPTEVNPFISEMKNYNFDAYDPVAGSYWDHQFNARIDAVNPGSNASYAHMSLCGERKQKYWFDSADAFRPMLGTRGPEDGATTGDKYTKSLTLQLQGMEAKWVGNIVFADNHVETLDTLEPASLQRPDTPQPYNLFRMDGGALSVSIASNVDDIERVWDPLVK